MKPGIRFIRESIDDDMVTLAIAISDGTSLFATRVYVGHQALHDTVQGLDAFKDKIAGGIFDLRFGEFGPEYAAGAFDARLQFRRHARILVQVSVQSEFARFEEREFASEARLYLESEPALLDEFILALKALSEGKGEQAELEALFWN